MTCGVWSTQKPGNLANDLGLHHGVARGDLVRVDIGVGGRGAPVPEHGHWIRLRVELIEEEGV